MAFLGRRQSFRPIINHALGAGSINVSAGIASVSVSAAPPTVALGSVSVAPSVATVSVFAVAPAISLGSVSVGAGFAVVMVGAFPPASAPPQSAAAGTLNVAAALIAPLGALAPPHPTLDVWVPDGRPSLWVLEP